MLFTDGRTRERVDDLATRYPWVEITVIDCERGTVRLGRARRIAEALAAHYVHIDWIAGHAPASDARSRQAAASSEPGGARHFQGSGARR
jgi:Mg-chelatase subunit ChlD